MNVDDVVAAKVEAARMRIESEKKARAARKAARNRGLALRHAAKLRAQAARRPEPPGVATPEPKELNMPTTEAPDVPEVRVFHRAAGWTLPFLSPDPQACTSNYTPEREGLPPCSATAVWKVAEVYADQRATIGFWCDDHMPAEHRHLAPHHTEGDRL